MGRPELSLTKATTRLFALLPKARRKDRSTLTVAEIADVATNWRELEYVSVKQASTIFGVTTATIRRWGTDGQLTVRRISPRHALIPVAEIRALLGESR